MSIIFKETFEFEEKKSDIQNVKFPIYNATM